MIALHYTNGVGFDLVNSNGLQLDHTLESACAISLFTDARATDEELRIAGLTKQSNRGWFGDTYPDVEGFVLGSKLWLLGRAKKNDETLLRAREYAAQALQWILDDQIAAAINVGSAWYRPEDGVNGRLVVSVEIVRPGNPQPRWRRLWDAISGEILES